MEERETGTSPTRDNTMAGIGGSLIFKSARWYGFGSTVGVYSSVPLHRAHTDPALPGVNFGRAGKDTYRTRADGTEAPLHVLGQATAEFATDRTEFRIGRQIIDSVLLASNDTKMIPQTFDAILLEHRPTPTTALRAGYVSRQKLRDRTHFHSVIAYERLTGNDDASAHRGMTPATLRSAGLSPNPGLFFASAESHWGSSLRLQGEAVALPGLVWTGLVEANYTLPLSHGWRFSTGLRVLRQFDDGAGAIGGAAINAAFARDVTLTMTETSRAKLGSYLSPYSADARMTAVRFILMKAPVALVAGTSAIANHADLFTPWRGFPTGGYTRTMGQIDWLAGNRNFLLKGEVDLAAVGLFSGPRLSLALHAIDVDEAKILAGTVNLTDRRVFTLDAIQSLKALPGVEFKLRIGVISADGHSTAPTFVNEESYSDTRFEMNWLF